MRRNKTLSLSLLYKSKRVQYDVPPLLLNCGQEDNNFGGGHEEYLCNTEEVSERVSLMTARSMCAHVFFFKLQLNWI